MESKKPPEHQAIVDVARYKGLSPRQRQDEEAAAVEAVLKRMPESRRDAFRKALNDPNAISGGSLDPETARHLGVIFSLRALAAEERHEKARLRDEALLDAAARVRIRIAIFPSLPRSGGYGVLIRTPEDDGIPLLVFKEGSLTDDDLVVGVNAAISSLDRAGVKVAKATTQTLRGRRGPGVTIAGAGRLKWSPLLPMLSPVREIQGLGQGRTMDLVASRPFD